MIHSLRESHVPVPELVMSRVDEDVLTMILEDLGPSVRQPTLNETASAAVAIHKTTPPAWLPVLDEAALRMLPVKIRRGIEDLASSGRWQEVDEVCIPARQDSRKRSPDKPRRIDSSIRTLP